MLGNIIIVLAACGFALMGIGVSRQGTPTAMVEPVEMSQRLPHVWYVPPMKRIRVVAGLSALTLAVSLLGSVAPTRGIASASAPSIGSGPLACLLQPRVDCRDVVHLHPFRFKGSLVGAKLARIHLRDADLSGATLRRVNLKGAILRRVNLSGADLRKANFGPAKAARSTGPIVRSTPTCAPNCQYANLMYADLSNADLRGANLSWAILVGANFRGANLAGANLSNAFGNNADFSRANLKGANVGNAQLPGALMVGASMAGANFARANLSYVDITDADMSSADLTRTCLQGVESVRTNLTGSTVTLAGFDYISMLDAVWFGVIPDRTDFYYATISGPGSTTMPLGGIQRNDTCSDF